jgi:Xaa-Pro aminopeptidase
MAHLPDGLILASAAPEMLRNGDVHHPYRQASDFLWLTGVEAPGYALLLDPRRGEEILFVPKLTARHAIWLGHIPSLKEARAELGVAKVAPLDDLPTVLRKRLRGRAVVHADRRSLSLVRRAAPQARPSASPLQEALAELRIVKDADELALLEAASAATAAGHRAAMRGGRPGVFEYQVQADLEHAFARAGCTEVGYGSIVAAGRNAAVLHYHANSAKARAGDLLLVDAGAECHGYTADVTRTFPVSGRFTARQRDIYEIVLAAQNRCIGKARAGTTSLDLQRLSEETLAEGLRGLRLLAGSVNELVETEAIRVFYPHGIGHPLGLDVHDAEGGPRRRLPKPRFAKVRFRARLEPGFVITVEPGIYFMPALLHDPEVRRRQRGRVDFARAESYLGLGGVRIEDDVVIRKSGPPRNLTTAPKTVAAVEAACAR